MHVVVIRELFLPIQLKTFISNGIQRDGRLSHGHSNSTEDFPLFQQVGLDGD